MTDGAARRKVTRRDVARLAGVSDAVVSYTLNGGAPVAAETAERVRRAVDELGYRPNRAALALSSGSASTIALMSSERDDPIFANPFFSEYAAQIEREARERGYALYATTTSYEPRTVRGRFDEFASRQVDGVLMLPGEQPLDGRLLDQVGLPWLALNEAVPAPGIGSLCTDLRRGALDAVTHLIEHGHQAVAYVGEDRPDEPRYIGWLEACARAGVRAGPFIPTEITRAGGYAAGLQIADLADRPRAVFVASDRTAVGVLRAFHERGVGVPDEIALVGFDGTWEGEYSWPALTTVRQPIEAMAVSAVDRVLQPGSEHRHELFPGTLVIRGSCGQHAS